MNPASSPRTMTIEEFLALDDDEVSRELIRGEVRERGPVIHGRSHARSMVLIVWEIGNWRRDRPSPRGKLVCGECGFILRGEHVSLVGIDVAYVSAELAAATARGAMFFDGPPVLAVEILEETDTESGMAEKIELYHEFGAVAWIADPAARTVSVHRPGQPPETFNERQELIGDPELPGFRVAVARLFE